MSCLVIADALTRARASSLSEAEREAIAHALVSLDDLAAIVDPA